jgi:DNA-3-methyladenine glycosylase II
MQTYKTQKQLQAALETLSASDKKLAAAFQEYGTPPMRPLAEGFIGLTRILISQQVSTAAAATIQARFEALLDEDDEAHAPHVLLALPEEDVRACGISRAKQSYMRHLAEAVVSGALNVAALRKADNQTVYDQLTAIKGIGPWTAQCYLLFSLRRADMFPAGDLALQQAVRIMYGMEARPEAAELTAFAARWAPHRGAAARLLWTYYNGEQAKNR